MEKQKVVYGWKALASMMQISLRKAVGLRAELLENEVIFYSRVGKPPRRRMCFWPSELVRWTREKGKRGEVI